MMGSCEKNNICPSVMKVNLENDEVRVNYLSSHVGQNNEVKHVRPYDLRKKNLMQFN